ncbi:hypothetical protein PJP07_30610, partial [Mycobacterium kansasii]
PSFGRDACADIPNRRKLLGRKSKYGSGRETHLKSLLRFVPSSEAHQAEETRIELEKLIPEAVRSIISI